MTAVYSKEQAKKSSFYIRTTANLSGGNPALDRTESQEAERYHRTDPATLRINLKASGDLERSKRTEICAGDPIEFALASEQEFARMLDAEDISWHYKPRTFAVEWDDDGNFVDCFTPDFYLSASETYIALIATDSSESKLKIRSVNLLRRQHPKIRIEILYSPYRSH
jgi:hypothetical protein